MSVDMHMVISHSIQKSLKVSIYMCVCVFVYKTHERGVRLDLSTIYKGSSFQRRLI